MTNAEYFQAHYDSLLRFCRTLNDVEITIIYLILSGFKREQIERMGIKKEAIDKVLKKAKKWARKEKENNGRERNK